MIPRTHWMKEYSKTLNGIGTVICKDDYIHEKKCSLKLNSHFV